MSHVPFPQVSDVTRKVMRANGNRDTKPEMVVRRVTHGMGFRYRLHRNDLPGRPDIVFPSRRKVILVNGCFWHQHAEATCRGARVPKTRAGFWKAKLDGNRARDERNVVALNQLGWEVLTIWECQLKDRDALGSLIKTFLNGSGM